jgi:hypothetical protein
MLKARGESVYFVPELAFLSLAWASCDVSDDGEVRALSEKSYELCAGAANHITSIGKCTFVMT